METVTLYAIISVIIVSLISVIFAIPFLFKKNISKKVLIFLLSMSVGVLLTTVFMDFLPESFAHSVEAGSGHNGITLVALYVMSGFLLMFIIEKFVHWHHNKGCEEAPIGHSHAYNLGVVNITGDAIHNLIDGLVIAGAYTVSIATGIAATISIIFHEVPQEIADFGVLLYAGFSKKKAIIFNLLSALTAIIGTVVGLFLTSKIHGFTEFIIPFAAGNFIYIAASNLVPQLHRHCKLWDTVLHVFAIVLGVALVVLVTSFAPEHAHG